MSNFQLPEIKQVAQTVAKAKAAALSANKAALDQKNKEAARQHLLRMQCLLTRLSTK